MKIAVTSQNQRTITGHAGRCRTFWVYDIADNAISDKRLVELAPDQTLHEIGHGVSVEHPLSGIEALISGGMGPGLAQGLIEQSITGLITAEKDPDAAVQAYLGGRLITVTPGQHRQDHHHHHGHRQGHDDHLHLQDPHE